MPRLSLFIAPGLLGGVSCNDAIIRSGLRTAPAFADAKTVRGHGSFVSRLPSSAGAAVFEFNTGAGTR